MSAKILFAVEIGLKVADLKTMTAFYRDKMDFTVELEAESHVFMRIGG